MNIQIDLTEKSPAIALGISEERCNELGELAAKCATSIAGTDKYSRTAMIADSVSNCNTLEEVVFSVYCLGLLTKTTESAHHMLVAMKELSSGGCDSETDEEDI